MERGQSIKKEINKQKWEESEFPIVCEVCLGDNPYIKMMKQKHGDNCRICSRPYTVFRWKAGTKGRFKRCEICQTCAKVKNVCQTCILDLQYGLPVQVRDKFLGENKVSLPTSDPNRDYWIQQNGAKMDDLQLPYHEEGLNPILLAQSKMRNHFERNKAKVCSFWEKGECTRGDLCPYAHEKRHDKEGPMAKQNIRDRFHGNNDPVASNILGQIIEKQDRDIQAPADLTITSVCLRNLPSEISQEELTLIFKQYGTINSIKILNNQYIAFINFASRKSAEDAVQDNYGNLIVKGNKVQCTWAKSKGYAERKDRGQLQYEQEMQNINQMITPQSLPMPPMMPGQVTAQQKAMDTASKLKSILNQNRVELHDKQEQKKKQLLDYSDDEDNNTETQNKTDNNQQKQQQQNVQEQEEEQEEEKVNQN